jgi:hypothetical protein
MRSTRIAGILIVSGFLIGFIGYLYLLNKYTWAGDVLMQYWPGFLQLLGVGLVLVGFLVLGISMVMRENHTH